MWLRLQLKRLQQKTRLAQPKLDLSDMNERDA